MAEKDKAGLENELEKFKADYEEAVSVGGDEAESYITAKDELKQQLVKAGIEEERADKEARMFTGIVTNGYQAYKDTERALGREPTKGFDEFKEEFYKLNSVINRSIDDTNEIWAEYDARNQTEFNEEQDIVEGKPSRKLYSAAMTNSEFKSFEEYYNNVRENKSSPEKEQFNIVSKGGVPLRVIHDIINHDYNNHVLSVDEWENLFRNIDKIELGARSRKKPKFSGIPIVLKVKTKEGFYGVAIELFERRNPIITTAFIDKEGNIDNWIKNEISSSGTKNLPFLRTNLKDIIYDIFPNFKQNVIQGAKFYQKAWHRGQNLEGGKFSLKYAGQATGQTHGYGVYASAQRDTGEYYRSRIDNGFTVKGEDITDLYSRLERKEEYGKLAIIEDLMLGKDIDALYEGTQEKAWYDKEIKPYLKSEGKLYKLDVPEDYELIDEQKRFSEQPEDVQEVLLKASTESKGFGLLEKAIANDEYGGVLYDALGDDVFYEEKGYEGGSNETRVTASEYLDKQGIKGITYDGGEEGKNFVIFNPDNVKVLEKFYSQTQGEVLGSYDPIAREVELFKGQNPSTLTHELGHHFLLGHLKLMESMGLKDRNAPVFEWLSKVVGRNINSVRDMEEKDTDEINPQEALVEAFISYMNEGEAPNLVTENIFKRAKDWLFSEYKKV